MNDKLKELAEQAGVTFNRLGASYAYGSLPDVLERFAELVRADEREACAVLVEAGNYVHPKAPDAVWSKTVAKLIRARSNHESQ